MKQRRLDGRKAGGFGWGLSVSDDGFLYPRTHRIRRTRARLRCMHDTVGPLGKSDVDFSKPTHPFWGGHTEELHLSRSWSIPRRGPGGLVTPSDNPYKHSSPRLRRSPVRGFSAPEFTERALPRVRLLRRITSVTVVEGAEESTITNPPT